MLFQVITTIAVTVAVFAAPTPDPRGASNGTVIPLTKCSSSLNVKKAVNTDVLTGISHDVSHRAKIIHGMKTYERNTGTPHPSAVKRDGSPHSSGAGIELTNWHNHELWYGTILVGTPSKSFAVQLDTGSSDIFVPASTGDENCRSHHNLWDPALSSTANALNQYFEIEFEDGGTTTGKQYTDNVTIAGFTADIQAIGAATTYSSNMAVSEFAPDGVLGLAFPRPLSSAYPVSPLFHTLFSEGKLPKPMFSLKLTASGGELYVGGMNEALYIENTLAFAPVTYPSFWELKIDNIKVNDKVVLTDVLSIIDTGANFIVGDPSRVLALHQAYGGKAFKNGFYTFPCSSFPSVTLTIGGKPFIIPANILGQGRVAFGSSDCFSGIVGPETDDDLDFWEVGTIFLQLFYTVFDFGSEPPQVGFAKLAS